MIPPNCGSCVFHEWNDDDTHSCMWEPKTRAVTLETRPDWCPWEEA